MRKSYILLTLICLTFSIGLSAQTTSSAISDLYIISSKAGKVNLTEGAVLVERNDGKNTGLNKNDDLKIGEKVSTGSTGKAEILLNPGSYLRLGENSEFEFATTDLDDLQVKLNKGSAILEVITNTEQGFIVGIQTPHTKTFILESGVYRIDILSDNSTKISVWKGKAQVGESNALFVKGGKFAIVKNSQTATGKFDRDNKDALDSWSKLRAKDLMAFNAKLREKDLRNSLLYSYYNRGWSTFDTYGVWVFDRFTATWCFMPFGRRWNSPYGWRYDYDMWRCNMPMFVIYNPPPNNTGNAQSPAYTGPRTGRNPRGERDPAIIPGSSNSDVAGSKPERDRPVFEGPKGDRGYSPSYDSGSRYDSSSSSPSSGSSTGSRNDSPPPPPPSSPPPPPPSSTGSKPIDN